MRILALVPGGINDQILFFPTLEDLKKQYPKATIDVLAEPRAKSAYRVCSSVNEVLTFDFKDRNGLADYLNLLGIIRDREYEVALNPGGRWTIDLLLWLNGIPARIGYKTNSPWFLSSVVPLKPEQYIAHRYHDLLQGLDIQSPCPELKITVPQEDIDWAEAEQKRLDIKESGYILVYGGIDPFDSAKESDSIYPVSKWQQIIGDIQQKQPNLPIVLLQRPNDLGWAGTISTDCPNLRVTSPPDIGKLAGAIAGANLLLCTDSVPMHLSVAVGTYTIALFGPTEAAQLLPPDHISHYIGIQSPTGKIADIDPDSVLKLIWRS